jgi:hypothetical protein
MRSAHLATSNASDLAPGTHLGVLREAPVSPNAVPVTRCLAPRPSRLNVMRILKRVEDGSWRVHRRILASAG